MKKRVQPLAVPLTCRESARTHREVYAAALMDVERDLRSAQAALHREGSNANRFRYAQVLARYDRLQGMFPFVAAGAADEQV